MIPWLLAVSQSDAKPAAPKPSDADNFWRNMIDPHGEQVTQVIAKALDTMQQPDNFVLWAGDADWVDQRARYYRDALNLLRYARSLSPDNIQVLALFARAADELGRTREALGALEACVRIAGPDQVAPGVAGQLGAIYLRMGDRDAGIRWLHRAQGPIATSGVPLVQLANALAAGGDVIAAIDMLRDALGTTVYAPETSLVAFSLAVIYDRDEQRGAAFEVLEHMQTSLQQQYLQQVRNELRKVRFAPAEDAFYYEALLYESLGYYAEARAQWAHYATSGDSAWRGRALDHIAAIDAERRATAAKPAPRPVPARGTP